MSLSRPVPDRYERPTRMDMRAEIIAIGDELVSGQRLDTNSQWLSRALGDLGIGVIRHTTVGDDLQENVDALIAAAKRVDLIVCTGGLGPTRDDLTREAIATAFDRPLELHEPSLQHIEALFATRGRPMPPRNRVQAMLPRGGLAIENPHGSAPGIDLEIDVDAHRVRVVALPGVPAEMQEMWHASVVPKILPQIKTGGVRQFFHVVKVFGIGESDLEARLPELFARGRDPTVGITVSRATITLRISSWAHNEAEFRGRIGETLERIHRALGDLVFGYGEMELEDRVARDLHRAGWRMASVEIGAASWIGDSMLQSVARLDDGSTAAERSPFAGSLAFSGREDALAWVDSAGAEMDLSPEVPELASVAGEPEFEWRRLADLVAQRMNADVVLVVDGYPSYREMVAATSPFPVQFVVRMMDRTVTQRRNLGGHPDVLGPRIAKVGLDLVRRAVSARHPKMV